LRRPILFSNHYDWYWQKAYKYNCNSLGSDNRVLPQSNPQTTNITSGLNYSRTSGSMHWVSTMASSAATIAVVEEEGKW
jgi:hypothetical protein